LHRLIRIFAILIFLISVESFALGLGNIESHSDLNQPLSAEIEVTGLGDVALSEITVALASAEAFEKVGLERPFFLTSLKFVLERKPDGSTVILMSTRDAIKEPFVDFLIEVDWPAGHMLREYTILLDPPLFLEERPAVIETPVSGVSQFQSQQTAASGGGSTVAQTRAPRSAASGSGTRVSSANGELSYGNVTRTDTLWSIAKQMRPDSSVTVQQVMMALLRNNNEAFYNNNVNYLKAGYVLRIPADGQIADINPADAEREIRLQNEAWQDAKGQRASQALLRAQGADQAAISGAAQRGVNAGGPRLKLVAPGAGEGGAALEGISDGTASNASEQASLGTLRSQMTMALENSEVSRQENIELKKRLAALEEQIASMQRLLTLRGDTLSVLQNDAGASGAIEQEAQQVPPAEVVQTEKTPAATPIVAPVPAPEQQDLISSILADPMLLGVAVVVLLLLLATGWIIMRRRQAADEIDFQDYEEESDDIQEQVAVAHGNAGQADGDITAENSSAESTSDSAEADTNLDIFHAEEDEIDTLAEADVYLAYRRFDKAEELLKVAISQNPERQDYILKLLEVYAAAENLDEFVLQAEGLYASVGAEGGEIWDKVVVMGRQLASDHPLFGGNDGVEDDQEADNTAEQDAFNLDIDEELSALDLEIDGSEITGESEQDDVAVDPAGNIEGLVEDTENADLEEAFSLLEDSEPVADQSGLGEKDNTAPDEVSDDLDLDLALDDTNDESLEENNEAMQAVADGEESIENVQQDSDLPNIDFQLADEEETLASDADINAEIDAEDHQPDAGSEEIDTPGHTLKGTGGTDTESGLESAAESLRLESNELSVNLGADDHASTATLETEQDQEEIPEALDADIDWLASAVNEEDLGSEFEDDSDLISGEDEISTKLDLARAYIDMGDQESARGILDEVMTDGSNDQKGEAEDLIRLIA